MTTILFNYSYPKWEEIPDIDLYLDQVLLYVNKVCAPFISETDKGLTASMVNNYVQHGYLPKPDNDLKNGLLHPGDFSNFEPLAESS